MPKIRCFLAIELDQSIGSTIAALVDQMATTTPGVKWVVPENLHLTLKFLGDIDENSSWEIFKAVQSSIGDMPPFQLTVQSIGAFPADDRPRTIWMGVTDGNQEICEAHARIDQQLADLGYAIENRRFQPHLTIGRVRDKASQLSLVDVIQQHKEFVGGTSEVDKIVLFRSELGRGKNGGPIYSKLGQSEFGTTA